MGIKGLGVVFIGKERIGTRDEKEMQNVELHDLINLIFDLYLIYLYYFFYFQVYAQYAFNYFIPNLWHFQVSRSVRKSSVMSLPFVNTK